METGFREHFAGAVLAAGAIGVALALSGTPLFGVAALLFAFCLGALLPDVDAQKSRPRTLFRVALALVAVFATLVFYERLSGVHWALVVAFPVGCFVLTDSLIPAHRGVLHSPLFALAWGAFCGLSTGSIALGFMAASGWLFHLLLDFLGDRA